MVGPEPHQPLDEADLGRARRRKPRPDLVLEDLLLGVGLLLGLRIGGWRVRRHLHGGFHGAAFGAFPFGGAHGELARLALLAEIEGDHRGLAAAHEAGVGDLPGARLLELGEQRAAGIGGDAIDCARLRAEAEAVERQRSLVFRVRGHGGVSGF